MKMDEAVRRFLAAEKPAWVIPTDVVVTLQLLILDGSDYPGHEKMGEICAVAKAAVIRSLNKLLAAGWVTPDTNHHTKVYIVHADKLPKGQSR